MTGLLNEAQIEYVLYHLNHHVKTLSSIRERFVFANQSTSEVDHVGKVIFKLSPQPLDLSQNFKVGEIPILFPLSDKKLLYEIDSKGNLIFHHDILKSVFYLLSGYQEYANQSSKDALSRFSFTDSIQYKLECTAKPIVNYYFQSIVEALEIFCAKHQITLHRNKLFQNFGFQLSHDIDVIDFYTYNYLGYKVKEIVGLRKSKLSFILNLKLFLKGLLKYLGISKRENPYWNFDYLLEIENKNHFKSIFFFLDQGVKNSDANYSFEEQRMAELFSTLKDGGHEIGFHGKVLSSTNAEIMEKSLKKLEAAAGISVKGIRQHRLLWKHPHTAKIQQQNSFQYDSTLGFAAHEGFRNSYCYPFKLYDFEADKMINMWEIPLMVMDGTLFSYQQYSVEKAFSACESLMEEVQKFGGVFTLLWHNSFFDEDTYPGVTKFYETLLQRISEKEPENILGLELCKRMDKLPS